MKAVLAFGDSNTWGLIPGSASKERYPWGIRWTSLLQERCPKIRVIEEGLCGRTTVFEDELRPGRRGITALPLILETHYPLDAAVVMLGTNDSKPQWQDVAGFEEGLRKILSQLPGRIMLMTAPKAYENEHGVIAYDVDDAFIYRDINPAVRKLAEEFHATLLDVYPYTCGQPEYFPDGVHPGMEGNMALAWLVHDEIIRL